METCMYCGSKVSNNYDTIVLYFNLPNGSTTINILCQTCFYLLEEWFIKKSKIKLHCSKETTKIDANKITKPIKSTIIE